MLEFCQLSQLALSAEILLPSITLSVPNAVVYTNVNSLNPAFGAHLMRDIYMSRSCALSEVSLIALPHGATVLGGGHFVLAVGSTLAAEHYPVYFSKEPDFVSGLFDDSTPVDHVDHEAFLLARYGIFTWGHWLGELLPKAVLVETAHPGRFLFALPYQVVADSSPKLPWIRIKESLACYGIGEDRIISIRPDRNYRFSSLFAVTSVWSDHMIHPGAANLMRSEIQVPNDVSLPRRWAISRIASYGRNIENSAEIEAILQAGGFTIRAVGEMEFAQQVARFRQAELLFGVLGSDFANLIYSPDGVKVITAAPAIFGDRFFYALVLARKGQQIDLRGAVTIPDTEIAHKSSFSLDADEVAKAILLFVSPPCDNQSQS